jgi:hypothetical protein
MKRMAAAGCGVVALMIVLYSGCKDMGTGLDTSPPPVAGTVSFSQKIQPIMNQYGCPGCHGGTSGLTVTTVASLLAGGGHGPAIVPGNADASILYQKISPTPPFGSRMPLGGPYMADTTIAFFRTWINEGAQNN